MTCTTPVRIIYFMLGICLLACGCTRIETLQRATPTGSPFQIALTRKYTAYAVKGAKEYDWVNSQHFIDKGMLTAYGHDAPPEDPVKWHISELQLPPLVAARIALMEILNQPEKVKANPQIAADAQFSYDCWVKEQEQNWRLPEIEACRDDFYDAIGKFNNKSVSIGSPVGVPATEVPSKEFVNNFNYRVFFAFDSAEITPEMQKVINNIIAEIKDLKGYEFVVNGYADRAGSEDYNLILSKKRAVAVRKRLVAGGIPESAITIYAYGEENNAVETPNGVPEAANRRVEIITSD